MTNKQRSINSRISKRIYSGNDRCGAEGRHFSPCESCELTVASGFSAFPFPTVAEERTDSISQLIPAAFLRANQEIKF